MNTPAVFLVGLLLSTSVSFFSGQRSAARAMHRDDTPVSRSNTQRAASADSALRPDPIARLQAAIDAGRLTLAHDSTLGYLPALLKELDIPVSSQGLVFSRTSLRTDLIAPWAPRALYFNDDVYIGWVPESEFLEIASVNATDGVAFYTLNQDAGVKPSFTRETNRCLMCHQSAVTGRVPGFLMNSTVTDRSGYPIATVRYGTTTDETPVKHRFGGWYVTGSIANSVHSGNVFSPKDYKDIDRTQNKVDLDLTAESALTSLQTKFDTSRYLSGQSDIVALMVEVHQTAVHTLISEVHAAARYAMKERTALEQYNERIPQTEPLAVANPRLRGAVERLVRAMLFIDEAPFAGAILGSSHFATEFSARGPRDKEHRSLRDFDLQTRLFRYPLSFLIYSEGFNTMPDVAKEGVYLRLRSILNGEEKGPEYLKLSDADRHAILQILRETKPDFAAVAAR